MDLPYPDWTTSRRTALEIADDEAELAAAAAWARVHDDQALQDIIDMEQPQIGAELARCFRNLDHNDPHAVDAIRAALTSMRHTLHAVAKRF